MGYKVKVSGRKSKKKIASSPASGVPGNFELTPELSRAFDLMWKVFVDKQPKAEARKQLSIFYGHVPIGKTIAMDRFFQSWDPILN